ncbi:MAG: hypothetical protein R2834_19000 [Rhodothermales bacterium]
MTIAAIALLVLIGIPAAHGQSAGAFARLGFGARGMAMGNAQTSDANASAFYNPALAPFATRQTLQASVALMTFDRELQHLQFSSALPPKAGIAIGLIHAGVNDIDGRNESGYHTESYATDEFAVFLAFGLRFGERVSGGLGFQIFRADYLSELEPVNSVGIDVGFTVKVTEALRLGFVADDLLAAYTWDTSSLFSSGGKRTSDAFPARVRLSGTYALAGGRGTLSAEYESRASLLELRSRRIELRGGGPVEVTDTEDLRIQESRFRIGGEYRLMEPFAVRAGVDRLAASSSRIQPTAGFVLEQPIGKLGVWFEYAVALEPYSVGTMHVMTLRLFL